MMHRKNHSRIVWLATWWALAVALVWLLGGRLEQAGEVPIAGEPAEADLKALWANAQAASGGRLFGSTSYFHRGEAVQVAGNVEFTGHSSDGLEQLERSYAAAGWTIDGETRGAPGLVSAKLCRGGIAIMSDARELPWGNRAYLAVVWTANRRHPVWCRH